jgi:hypothetical protein
MKNTKQTKKTKSVKKQQELFDEDYNLNRPPTYDELLQQNEQLAEKLLGILELNKTLVYDIQKGDLLYSTKDQCIGYVCKKYNDCIFVKDGYKTVKIQNYNFDNNVACFVSKIEPMKLKDYNEI